MLGSTLRGLFGAGARMLMGRGSQEQQSADQAPVKSQPFPSNGGDGKFPVGSFILGGYSGVDRQRSARAAAEARQRQEQLAQTVAQQYGENPLAMLLFQADPEGFAEVLAKSLEPATLSGGQIRTGGLGGKPMGAPKIDAMGDVVATTDPIGGGTTYSAPRPKTYAETEAERANRERESVARGQLGVSQGQLGVAQGRLGLERQKHQARQAAGGYGTPGVGGVIGAELDPSEWEILP